MKCPKCGGQEFTEVTYDQDMQGNDLRMVICANGDCEYEMDRQDHAGQCLHPNVEIDLIDRRWCLECGDYLGER
jgi:hypothetical protein